MTISLDFMSCYDICYYYYCTIILTVIEAGSYAGLPGVAAPIGIVRVAAAAAAPVVVVCSAGVAAPPPSVVVPVVALSSSIILLLPSLLGISVRLLLSTEPIMPGFGILYASNK